MTDFIEIHDGVLEPKLCEDIITRFNKSPHIHRGRTGHGVDLEKKDSYDLTITPIPEWEGMVRTLMDKAFVPLRGYLRKYLYTLVGAISPAVKHPKTGKLVTLTEQNFAELGEPHLDQLIGNFYRYGMLNVQKYLKGSGGYPHWHSEIYPKDDKCDQLHRVLAFQFYLNDVAAGGETEFYYQQRKVESRAGRMIIFPAGFTHTHRGNRPESGEKYIITSWVLFHRAEDVYRNPPPPAA
jgi:hypothetical protein